MLQALEGFYVKVLVFFWGAPGSTLLSARLTAGCRASPPRHHRCKRVTVGAAAAAAVAVAAMPSAWRKARLGEIPRLLASAVGSRAKRGVGNSALVVQAGFPTSVADLVVKNRGRLTKKAPRWLQRRRHHGEAEADVKPGSVVSEIVAAGESGDVVPLPVSALRPAETDGEEEEEAQRLPVVAAVEERWDAISGVGPGSSRWEAEAEAARDGEVSASEASTRPEPQKDAFRARNRWRFMMPSKVVFLVFVLTIGTQKIALGASISAFFILLLESLVRRRIPFSLSREGLKKKTSSTIGGVFPVPHSNGRIPVKNLAAFSERSLEYKAPLEARPSVLALEPKDHVEEEGSRGVQKANNSSKKANKLLKKFVPKKLRRVKGQKAELASECRSRGASHHTGEGEEPPREEEDDGAGNKDEEEGEESRGTLGFVVAAGFQDVGFKSAAFLVENPGGQAKGSSPYLVLFLFILSGLVGGRIVAMVLTVLWCLLASFSRSLCKYSKIQQSH